MEALEQILLEHARKYPKMEPVDGVKLIYQNVFGGGHLIRDPKACLRALEDEYRQTPRNPQGLLLEEIGNGMVRVMLNAIDSSGWMIGKLGEAFLQGSREHKGTLEDFLRKLDVLRRVTASGAFGFSTEELEAYLADYERSGYPMVSHSEQYRETYRPAYRVVPKRLLEMDGKTDL